MTTTPHPPRTTDRDRAHWVAAAHIPDDRGFCQGCLAGGRLTWSPCLSATWAETALTTTTTDELR